MKIEITFKQGSPLHIDTDDENLITAAMRIYLRFRDTSGRNIVIEDIDTVTIGLD